MEQIIIDQAHEVTPFWRVKLCRRQRSPIRHRAPPARHREEAARPTWRSMRRCNWRLPIDCRAPCGRSQWRGWRSGAAAPVAPFLTVPLPIRHR